MTGRQAEPTERSSQLQVLCMKTSEVLETSEVCDSARMLYHFACSPAWLAGSAMNPSTATRLGIPACPPRRVALSAAAAEANRILSPTSSPRASAEAYAP